jgi:DNA-binding PadR family transcriptional regulator
MAESLEAAPLAPRTFYVLLALAEGKSHGSAIASFIKESTSGTVRLTPGILYPMIKQMLDDGWITEIDDPGDDRKRSYRLTARGRRVARDEAERLTELVRMAHNCKLIARLKLG